MEGTPDYHIVILAPGLSPEWFFGAAQPYWNTFRPSVTTRWDFIDFVPNDRSLAATIIAPPDVAESIQKALKQRYIHIVTDILLARRYPAGSRRPDSNCRYAQPARLCGEKARLVQPL